MIILRYLYTFWSALIFILLLLLAVPFFFITSLLFPKKDVHYALSYNKMWTKVWGTLSNIRYQVIHYDRLDLDTEYMFVANHTSMLDAIIVNEAIKHKYFTLGKKELLKIPIMGYLLSKAVVFVDRSSPESRKQSVLDMKSKAIDRHISLLVFPEGTRNKSSKIPLKSFYSGAFRIAIDLQIPISPFVIIGTREIWPNEKLLLYPGTIKAVFASPIPTTNLTYDDLPQLKEQVYQVMEQLILTHDDNFNTVSTPTPPTSKTQS